MITHYKKYALLYSGGFESFCSLISLIDQGITPKIIYIKSGSEYEDIEFKKARDGILFLQDKFKIDLHLENNFILSKSLDLNSFLIDEKTSFVPFRNLYFILNVINELWSIGLGLDNANNRLSIILGYNKDDRVHDSGDTFCNNVNTLLRDMISTKIQAKIQVESLFSNYSKLSMVQYVMQYGITRDELEKYVFSCYHPVDGNECLNCKACFRKNVILHSIGIDRPFSNEEIIKETKSSIDNYLTNDRKYSTLSYLKYLESLTNNKED